MQLENYFKNEKIDIDKYISDTKNDREYVISDEDNISTIDVLKPNMIEHYLNKFGFASIPIPFMTKSPNIKEWQNINKETCLNYAHLFNYGSSNIGILSGKESNIFVIDIDFPKDGEIDGQSFLDLKYNLAKLDDPNARHHEDTLVQITGSGGKHLIYKYEPILDLITNQTRVFKTVGGKHVSIDIKTNKGQIIAPPSIHPNGKSYRFDTNASKSPKRMPSWLLKLMFDILNDNNFKYPIECSVTKVIATNDKKITYDRHKKNYAKDTDDIVEKKIRMLNKTRWDNYDNWIGLITLLSNLSKSSGDENKYYELCIELSKQSFLWDDKSQYYIDYNWKKPKREKSLTMGTLNYWLSQDISVSEYRKFLPKIKDYVLSDHLNFSGYDINNADDFNEMYSFMISCIHVISNTTGNMFVICKNSRVNNETGGIEHTFDRLSLTQIKEKLKQIKITDIKLVENKKNKLEKTFDIAVFDRSLEDVFDVYINKHIYMDVIFYPYSEKSTNMNIIRRNEELRNFNTFTGFPIKYESDFAVDMDRIAPILSQINSLCNDTESVYNYLLNWLAHIVQNPSVKTSVGVLFRSIQGTGKSSFFKWFGNAILGSNHYVSISSIDQATGRFNNTIVNKLLIVCEEVNSHENDYKTMNKMKDLITNPEQIIEQKGKDAVRVLDCCNFVFLTNRLYSIRIEENDRRYLCLEASKENVGNTNYWNKMMKNYQDEETTVHFFHYLMNRDLDNFSLSRVPITKIKEEMISRSATPLAKFFYGKWVDGLFEEMEDNGVWTINYDDFFTEVTSYLSANENGFTKNITKTSLSSFVKTEMGIVVSRTQKDNVRKRLYTFSKSSVRKLLETYKYDLE